MGYTKHQVQRALQQRVEVGTGNQEGMQQGPLDTYCRGHVQSKYMQLCYVQFGRETNKHDQCLQPPFVETTTFCSVAERSQSSVDQGIMHFDSFTTGG